MIPHPKGGWVRQDDPGEPQTGVGRISISELEAGILAAVAADRTVIEIGTGLGVSTRALASTARSVTTVDIDPWVHETIWPDLPDHVERLRSLPADGQWDVAFIDGDHNRLAVRTDLRWCYPRVHVIVAHDTNHQAVRAECDRVGPFVYLRTEHGLGLWRT